MFVTQEDARGGPRLLAGEEPSVYSADPVPVAEITLAEAVAALEEALDVLAAVELDAEGDREVLDGVLGLERAANRLAGMQLRTLCQAGRREAYGLDGAATLTSWYRARTHLDHGEASRRVHATNRLDRFPRLAAALAEGEVSLGHVLAVTTAAVPTRMEAIAEHEGTLVELALNAGPREVKVALRRIADQADPDGSEDPPPLPPGPDPRRELNAYPTVDGLVEVRGLLDQIDGEALLTALDAAETPDPPDTPADQRRSPGQRRADALGLLARRALDSGGLPIVQGNKPHLLLIADLKHLLGIGAETDGQTARGPRLRWTGALDPRRARQLALAAKLTVVLTMGPWRVVNVGRTMRTLPPWLRGMLELVHHHCRGPDCDRPAVWTEAHHEKAWEDGGETDLNATIPLCHAHHDLVTTGAWTVCFNPDTGVCTWTSRHGITRTTHAAAA